MNPPNGNQPSKDSNDDNNPNNGDEQMPSSSSQDDVDNQVESISNTIQEVKTAIRSLCNDTRERMQADGIQPPPEPPQAPAAADDGDDSNNADPPPHMSLDTAVRRLRDTVSDLMSLYHREVRGGRPRWQRRGQNPPDFPPPNGDGNAV